MKHKRLIIQRQRRPQTDLRSTNHTQHWSAVWWYMDYFLFTEPGGMEGWVGLVGWSI